MSEDTVSLNISPGTLISILKRAASQERTVVEFQTQEEDGERKLSRALDITDHVDSLEENQDVTRGSN